MFTEPVGVICTDGSSYAVITSSFIATTAGFILLYIQVSGTITCQFIDLLVGKPPVPPTRAVVGIALSSPDVM